MLTEGVAGMKTVPGGPIVVKVGILSRGDRPAYGPTDSELTCRGNGEEEEGANGEEEGGV